MIVPSKFDSERFGVIMSPLVEMLKVRISVGILIGIFLTVPPSYIPRCSRRNRAGSRSNNESRIVSRVVEEMHFEVVPCLPWSRGVRTGR
jgi:hypothetical protein